MRLKDLACIIIMRLRRCTCWPHVLLHRLPHLTAYRNRPPLYASNEVKNHSPNRISPDIVEPKSIDIFILFSPFGIQLSRVLIEIRFSNPYTRETRPQNVYYTMIKSDSNKNIYPSQILSQANTVFELIAALCT